MTKNKVEKFRRVLEARVVELNGSARHRDAIFVEGNADELDRGLRATERELAVRNLEAISAKRWEARAALQRIEEGSYGACLDCGATISPARLAALPWAALCLRCQETDDCRCAASSARPVLAMAA
jgi:DnaK suppressor protein